MGMLVYKHIFGCWRIARRAVLLKSDVRVGNQEGAENGVHDGVEGAGGEGSDSERDQTDTDTTDIQSQYLKQCFPFRD